MRSGQRRAAARLGTRGRVAWATGLLTGLLLLGGSALALSAPAEPRPGSAPEAPQRPRGAAGERFVVDEVLVRFEESATARGRADARQNAGTRRLQRLGVPGLEHLEITDGRSVARAIKALEATPGVRYAQPNYRYQASTVPSDPRYVEQWGLHNTGKDTDGTDRGTADADIDAPEAWDRRTDASSVTVAVVDSGVDYVHPDLADNIWTNAGEIAGNGADDDGNGKVDDVHGWDFVNNDNDPQDPSGHGTHVAGTVGASGNNAVGVTGVAWDVQLMPVRVLNAAGGGTSVDIMNGYAYAAANGAQIINASLGGSAFDQATADVIAAAGNTLFVVAAGNAATDNDVTHEYPCDYTLPNIVCVAATDAADALAEFSNWSDSSVDLAAPGVDILSTYPKIVLEHTEDFSSTSGWGFYPLGSWDWEATDGNYHLSDSVGGVYVDGENDGSVAQRTVAYDLSGRAGCTLSYDSLWALGDGDWVTVEGALSSTGPWHPLKIHIGHSAGRWQTVETDLLGPPDMAGWPTYDFNGNRLWLQLVMHNPADGSASDGIYFDNIQIACQTPTTATNANYQLSSGTSMATPHVAGAAALVLADNPGMTATQLKGRLLDTVDPTPALDGKTVTGGRLNLDRALAASDPAGLDCTDANASDTTSGDVEVNPTFGAGATETYTCTVTNVLGDGAAGKVVNVENLGGANDGDDDAAGGPTSTADGSCTTGTNGSCTVQMGAAEGEEGDAALCFWGDTDGDGRFDAAGDPADGGACGEDLHGDAAGGELTDVTKITWNDPNMYLDCDDRTGDDKQLNNVAATPTETYTCTVTDHTGNGLSGLWVDLENLAGANDADDDATGGAGDQADGGCSLPTDANGECTVDVTATEAESGVADICFWVDRDGDHGFDSGATGAHGSANGGYCDDIEEPWDEADATDREEKARLEWTDCTAVWDGSVNNHWQGTLTVNGSLTDINWTYLVPHPNVFPVASDRACIGEGHSVIVNTTDTIGALDNDGELSKNGNTLTIEGLGRPSELGTFNLSSGTVAGAGAVKVDKTMTWSGGALSGSGVTSVLPDGVVRITGAVHLNNYRPLDNAGTVEFGDGGSIGSPSNPGVGTLHNLDGGTVVKTGTAESQLCNYYCVWLHNDGTVRAESGVLRVNAPGSGSGAWETSGDGVVKLISNNRRLDGGTSISGTGVAVAGGTAELVGTIAFSDGAALNLTGGSITGEHTLTGPGRLVWSDGSIAGAATTTLGADFLMEITGHVNVGAGRTIDNHGRVGFTGDATMGTNSTAAPSTVNNLAGGRMFKSSGTGESHVCNYYCVTVNNDGRMWAEAGTLRFQPGTSTGTFDGTGAGVVRQFGTHTFGDGTTFTGSNVLLDSSAVLNGAIDFAENAEVTLHGTLTGDHTLHGPGTLVWTDGSITQAATTTIAPDMTLRVEAGTTLSNGREVENHGRIEINGDHALRHYGTPGVLHNHDGGVVVKTAGTGTAHFNGNYAIGLENDGVVRSDSGTLDVNTLTPDRTSNGRYVATAGNVLRFGSGDHVLGEGVRFAGAGDVVVAGGKVTVDSTQPLIAADDFSATLRVTGGQLLTTTGATLGAGTTVEHSGGTIGGAGTLHLDGTLIWSGGTSAGPGNTAVSPTGLLKVTGAPRLSGARAIDVAGTMEFADVASVGDSGSGATVNNLAGGLVVKTGSGTAHFCNNYCVPLTNGGVVRAEEGLLQVNGGGTGAGHWATTGTGAAHFVGQPFTLSGHNSFAGTAVSLRSGTVTATGTLQVADGATLNLDGGTVAGDHTVAGPGIVDWSAGTWNGPGTATLAEDAHVKVTGAVRISGGRILDNHGTFEFAGDTSVGSGSTGTLNNMPGGRVFKSAGAGESHFCNNYCVVFNNDGTVSSDSGTLTFSSGTSTGTFAGTAGAFLRHSGTDHTFADGTTFTGPNLTLLSTMTATGAVTLAEDAEVTLNGTLQGEHTFQGAGTLRWTGGSISQADTTTIAHGTTMKILGEVRLSSGRVIENHGTIDFAGDTTIGTSSSATIRNRADGLVVKSAGTGRSHFNNYYGVPLHNDGTVRSASGTLDLTGGLDAYDSATKTLTKGTYEAVAGAVVALPSADIRHNQATVELQGTGAAFRTGAANALANLTTNSGTVRLLDGAALATVVAPLTNSGTVLVGSDGTLTAPAYTQTAGETRLTDATSGNGTTATLVANPVLLEGGTLSGNGTIDGDVVNTGAAVAPGNSPGTLRISGGYAQSGDGVLEIEVDGADSGSFDLLDVGGAATLGGTLKLVLGDGHSPSWEDALAIISSPAPPTGAFDAVEGAAPPADGVEYDLQIVDGLLTVVTVDTVAPVNPVLSSPSHTPSRWSRDRTVKVDLADAADNYAGVEGFAVVWNDDAATDPPAAATLAATTRSITSPSLDDGTGHWLHVRTVDKAGNWSATTHLGPWWIDRSAPTKTVVTTPSPKAPYSLLTSGGGVPRIKAVWPAAADAASGVRDYQVVYRTLPRVGNTFSPRVKSQPMTTRSFLISKAVPGTTYCFAVRTTDHAGNAATGGQRCGGIPLDEDMLRASSQATGPDWTTVTGKAMYGGSAVRTKTNGATLTRKSLETKRLALIARTCATCGDVQVLWNGTSLGTFSLDGGARQKVVIPVKTFGRVKAGTLVIRTTTNKLVTIDGVAVSKR